MGPWLVAGASAALLLAAAKAHGRQLRVERELQGHAHVVFGGSNDPWVEALWRRDRMRFWTFAPAASLGLALAAGWRWPGEGLVLATAIALWGPVCAFVAAGLLSAGRFARASRAPAPPRPAAWIRSAWRGSLAWWGLVAGGALAVAALLAA